MSLRILKPGVLDTVQDVGRFGYSHLGLGPAGAVDEWAMATANTLVGNAPHLPVIEMNGPSASMLFLQATCVAVAGACAAMLVGGLPMPTNRAVLVPAGTPLRIMGGWQGQRLYLAVAGGLEVPPVLGSASQHVQAGIGQALQAGEELAYKALPCSASLQPRMLPYFFAPLPASQVLPAITGPEWNSLTTLEQAQLLQANWVVQPQSNRMAVQLAASVPARPSRSMVSAPVSRGTVQYLPNGQLLVLAAEHQTIGGYPRVLQLARHGWSALAKAMPGQALRWQLISLPAARQALAEQQKLLVRMQSAVAYALSAHGLPTYFYQHGH